MKILNKVITAFIILVLIVGGLFFDAYNNAPNRFIARFETLSSTRIPEQLNNTNILYFSDVHFGKFMDINRFKKLINLINNSGADIILFGGDLLHSESVNSIDNETLDLIKELLKSIDAPLGKFAVYGDQDHNNLDIVNQILYDSNFEIINNDNIKLRNKGSQSINIVGIDSEDNGNINIEQAYNNIPKLSYTITLCHTPDTVVKIEKNLTDLYLSGHSLGGQAYFIFDSLYKPDFTSLYYRGKHTIDDKVKVDISSGTGTVIEDVRFLSNAEIVIYTLKHKQFQDNTDLPE